MIEDLIQLKSKLGLSEDWNQELVGHRGFNVGPRAFSS